MPMIINRKFNEIEIPPRELKDVIFPNDEWYIENRDPKAHQRILRVDRGFYMFSEWWDSQNLLVSYSITEESYYHVYGMLELEERIRELHAAMAPHQRIESSHLVFGVGAMQLLNAVLYAIFVVHSLKKFRANNNTLSTEYYSTIPASSLYVTEQLPGYLELRSSVREGMCGQISWIEIPQALRTSPEDLLEFVVTPCNPDGLPKFPITKAKHVVHDRVNHMPIYLNENKDYFMKETLENDAISIFSLSKFTGFSGTRVGYAFVKDPEVAHYMKNFVLLNTHGISNDGQIRCLHALRHLLKGKNLQKYIEWSTFRLKERWNQLKEALRFTKFTLLNNQGANAWLKTPLDSEMYINKSNIIATYGPEYGVGKEYIRFNMLGKENEFQELLYRLKKIEN